jgi:hypothetical protein
MGMPYEEIDGVPIGHEEHGDATGPTLVALQGGIVTFRGSFGDVLRGGDRPGRGQRTDELRAPRPQSVSGARARASVSFSSAVQV